MICTSRRTSSMSSWHLQCAESGTATSCERWLSAVGSRGATATPVPQRRNALLCRGHSQQPRQQRHPDALPAHVSLRLAIDLQAKVVPFCDLGSASRVVPNWPRPSTLPRW